MKLTKLILIVACFLVSSRSGLADSILVGTTLTSVTGGAGLCPSAADCLLIAQQFTLLQPVVIDQIKVVIAGPYLLDNSDGNFSVSLAGSGPIGSGDLVFDPDGHVIVAQLFDFGGLNISLGPGIYYLVVSGANVTWTSGDPLLTSTGIIGPERVCDPTVQSCTNPADWQPIDHPRAMEVDGTVVPEPSSLLLFGTGLLGLCGVARYKLRHLTT
jgi:hypothetical protein